MLYDTYHKCVVGDLCLGKDYDGIWRLLASLPGTLHLIIGNPKTCMINCHGHLHTKNKFYEDRPYMYNVSVDANNNKFITLDDVLREFHQKVCECKQYL